MTQNTPAISASFLYRVEDTGITCSFRSEYLNP
jgi:hypothetical protein